MKYVYKINTNALTKGKAKTNEVKQGYVPPQGANQSHF